MNINLWGVRGSIPVTGPETATYGGNTSCVSVWEDGSLLVLDGGSGIQRLELVQPLLHKRIDILLTHLHLDHIQGLGFFKPLFDPSMEIHLWGPASSTVSLHARLSRYLSPPLFPVRIRDLPSKIMLHEIGRSVFKIGPFTVHSDFVIHPGPTVGYRIEGNHSVMAYLPDHEPALGQHGMIPDSKWISGIGLAQEADVLLHDAQYTSQEYPDKKGWGHSSWEDAGLFASRAGVKRLLFMHHDPSRTDAQVNEIWKDLQGNTAYSFKSEPAREGMRITLK